MIAVLLAFALAQKPPVVPDDAALVDSLRSTPGGAAVVERAAELRAQALVAVVAQDAKGRGILARRGWRVDAEYAYPANALGLVVAVAALADLEERRAKEPRLSMDTPLAFHPLFAGQAVEDRDASHQDGGTITLRHEIRKLFLASDDAAFNRLYEYVGRDALAKRFERAGLSTARVVHRASVSRDEDGERRAPRIDFVLSDTERVTIPERASKLKVVDSRARGVHVGGAYVDGTRRVDAPMSFARWNSISLVELQDALARLVEPALALDGEPWAISGEARSTLLSIAAEYPSASRDPRYPKAEFPDENARFVLPGLERVAPRATWRVAGSRGRALGFSTENAWIVHLPSGRGAYLAATIHTNADGVVNDGVYEYDTVASAYFAALGEIVGRELAR